MAILQQIKVPLVSVNDRSLTVIEIPFVTGDAVKQGDILIVFETSKTTYEVRAEFGGYIQYLCSTGIDYEVNTNIALIVSESSEIKQEIKNILETKKRNSNSEADAKTTISWVGETIFSKAALDVLELRNINRKEFTGHDFINKADIMSWLEVDSKKILFTSLVDTASKKEKSDQSLSFDKTDLTALKLASGKKREIEYLSSVQSSGLTSTINTFIETEGIFINLNQSLQVLKNSLLPVTIYEVSRLLIKYKELNAFYAEDTIYYHNNINIGFAIDLEKGLKVLNIIDTPYKTIIEIEEEILHLSGKYLDDTIHINDLMGVTFTITDLSAEGVALFRPLVNFQNSAILAISSIDKKLDRCMFSVTFDHRVTEGKQVARFLKDLKDMLESYRSNHFTKQMGNVICFKCNKTLEEDISDVGFAKVITQKNGDTFICQSCLTGF